MSLYNRMSRGHTFNYIIEKFVKKMDCQQAIIFEILSRHDYSIYNKFEYVDKCMKNVFFYIAVIFTLACLAGFVFVCSNIVRIF